MSSTVNVCDAIHNFVRVMTSDNCNNTNSSNVSMACSENGMSDTQILLRAAAILRKDISGVQIPSDIHS